MTKSAILMMPYAIAPRAVIEKCIEIGLLQRSRRHDVKAVERAFDAFVDQINELSAIIEQEGLLD